MPVAAVSDGILHIVLRSLHPIAVGEQICYDYGDDYWRYRSPPKAI